MRNIVSGPGPRVRRRKSLVVGHNRVHSQLGPKVASGMCLFRGPERRLIGLDVEELRLSARLRFSHGSLLGGNEMAQSRVGIVHITGDDCLHRTNDYTSRLELRLDSMRAEVTFLGGVGVGVDIERVVWTRLHARLATDAAVAVEIDDAVVATEERSDRTYGDAGCVIAVIAPQHRKEPIGVGELTLLDVLDPGPESAKGNFVFGFAGDCARMTADTFAVVYDEAVFHPGV